MPVIMWERPPDVRISCLVFMLPDFWSRVRLSTDPRANLRACLLPECRH
jgi:hypothetical protein